MDRLMVLSNLEPPQVSTDTIEKRGLRRPMYTRFMYYYYDQTDL